MKIDYKNRCERFVEIKQLKELYFHNKDDLIEYLRKLEQVPDFKIEEDILQKGIEIKPKREHRIRYDYIFGYTRYFYDLYFRYLETISNKNLNFFIDLKFFNDNGHFDVGYYKKFWNQQFKIYENDFKEAGNILKTLAIVNETNSSKLLLEMLEICKVVKSLIFENKNPNPRTISEVFDKLIPFLENTVILKNGKLNDDCNDCKRFIAKSKYVSSNVYYYYYLLLKSEIFSSPTFQNICSNPEGDPISLDEFKPYDQSNIIMLVIQNNQNSRIECYSINGLINYLQDYHHDGFRSPISRTKLSYNVFVILHRLILNGKHNTILIDISNTNDIKVFPIPRKLVLNKEIKMIEFKFNPEDFTTSEFVGWVKRVLTEEQVEMKKKADRIADNRAIALQLQEEMDNGVIVERIAILAALENAADRMHLGIIIPDDAGIDDRILILTHKIKRNLFLEETEFGFPNVPVQIRILMGDIVRDILNKEREYGIEANFPYPYLINNEDEAIQMGERILNDMIQRQFEFRTDLNFKKS